MPARRLSLHPMRLRPSPCGGDLSAARRGRMPRLRGDARSRELRPNPIRPDTSRHRTVATSEGNPTPCAVDSAEAMPPARTIPSHAPLALVSSRELASSRLVGPRASCLRRPPAASARFHGRAGKPNGHADDPLARIRRTARHGSTNELLAQPGRRGQGPLHPLLREEHRDQPHPRCLPSMSRLRLGHRTYVQRSGPSAGPSPQIVTNLWIVLGALFTPVSTATLTGQRGQKRDLRCD